jgi:alkylation response protein AidB-like acyl-CoA dehydrogenase
MHNLQLNEDQDIVVDTVRKFVADTIAPVAQEADEHRRHLRAEFDGLAELGVYGLLVAEPNGGAGMGMVPFAAALEAVGAQSSSLARLWLEQSQCAAALEVVDASAELEAVMAGAATASFVGPEHGLRVSGGRVSGTAAVVAGGAAAEHLVVAARDGDSLVLALVAGAAGKRSDLRVLGLASAACARIEFAGAEAKVLATGEVAQKAIRQARLAAWIGTAATAIGGALAAIDAARKHAGERIAFGKPLLVQQAVQRKLVECRRHVDAARQLTWHAARMADLGHDAIDAAIQARISAVDAMVLAADEAIQIHGGFGYTVEYHVERHYRDAKMMAALDSGSDHLRDELARRQFA